MMCLPVSRATLHGEVLIRQEDDVSARLSEFTTATALPEVQQISDSALTSA